MSNKSSLSSRVRHPFSSDIPPGSFFQEEIQDLIFSRRVDLRNIIHLQTLSGHVFDILKSLSEQFETTFQRLESSCRNFSINPSLVCESLYMAVCRYYLWKVENYDKTKSYLADENSTHQTESYDLFQLAVEMYLRLIKNSTQNSRGRKTSSIKKSGDNTSENRSTFKIRTIPVKKMSRFMLYYYNKLNFERWFAITKLNIQKFSDNDRFENDLPHDFTTVMNHDNGFRFINYILSYYTKTCISVADRAFLNEIYGVFWDEACVIHGSSYNKTYSLNRSFKFPGNQTTGKMKNRMNKKNFMSTEIDFCPHKSYDKKIKYALNWLNNLFIPPVGLEKSRLLIIARSEEELISFAINLQKEFAVGTIYYFCCGLVGFSIKKTGIIDTKLFKPDRCSETIEQLPVNTASVSMYTYSDFLQQFLNQGKNGNATRGDLILSNVLLWGVPDDYTVKDGYNSILNFLRKNKIPALAVTDVEEKNAAKFFTMEDLSKKEKNNRDTDYPEAPVLTRINYEFLDKNYKLNSDFNSTILKNHRKGLNQIILCPNSLYVQKMYFELEKILVDKRLPIKNLEIYHSMFGLLDKHAKRQKMEYMINKGGALIVSTLNFFPDLICEIPLIFIEGLPVNRRLLNLINSLENDESEKKANSSPQIFWSVGIEREKDSSSLIDDIVEENQILVPDCNIAENQYVDIANRFVVPDYLTEKITGHKDSIISETIYISGKKENIGRGIHSRRGAAPWNYVESKLPYNCNLGLIGPPHWIDKFIP